MGGRASLSSICPGWKTGGKGRISEKMRGYVVERGDLGTGCFKKSGRKKKKKRVAGQRIKSQELFTRGCWVKAWPWATNHGITRLEGILRGYLVHTPTIQLGISTIPNRWDFIQLWMKSSDTKWAGIDCCGFNCLQQAGKQFLEFHLNLNWNGKNNKQARFSLGTITSVAV